MLYFSLRTLVCIVIIYIWYISYLNFFSTCLMFLFTLLRLRAMLRSEEQRYLREMEAGEETVLERQAKMRERAKFLKDKREEERLNFVQEKYDQQFRYSSIMHRSISFYKHWLLYFLVILWLRKIFITNLFDFQKSVWRIKIHIVKETAGWGLCRKTGTA